MIVCFLSPDIPFHLYPVLPEKLHKKMQQTHGCAKFLFFSCFFWKNPRKFLVLIVSFFRISCFLPCFTRSDKTGKIAPKSQQRYWEKSFNKRQSLPQQHKSCCGRLWYFAIDFRIKEKNIFIPLYKFRHLCQDNILSLW